MTGRRLLVALSTAVLTIGLGSETLAQSRAADKKGRETQSPALPAGEKKPAPRKVLRLEEMRVEGRVQKPQALFLMPRANVNSGEQDRSESFLSKTKEAVEKDPF
ncbi:MAG TPA: hypothetical protein VFG59_18465 [Anaeromyxobacter sp.]|nr:hypothetical protein [Anaeromyxobacter sp.]